MSELAQNLATIEGRIEAACDRAGRARDEVTLVAVSKTFDAPVLNAAYDLGIRDFGESYVQEWTTKRELLPEDIRWHFIGHLQSNKVKFLEQHVHLVHSVDRSSLLKALEKHSEVEQPILLQFNVAGETQKSGAPPDELEALLERVTQIPNLSLQGLMTVPPYDEDASRSRPHFVAMRALQARAKAWLEERGLLDVHPCHHLSMGMSGDFEVAIEEGATLIRVGSALFGSRT